ncbi:MAG: hypothetical protein EPN33_08630 [Acidobacteria bacterium]|nr:MAG: hypothetical protein EPN33_08630 [Acidobacteriota bacterium]
MKIVAAAAVILALAGALGAQEASPCQQQAWALAAQGHFHTAVNAMTLCSQPPEASDFDLLLTLAQTEYALQRHDWPAATAAMQHLPAAVPAALDNTLAPAFARFGAGAPSDAALLARTPARLHAAAALPFQAFLRHEYTAHLWRRFALPGVALFLLTLIASLALGLRQALALS